MELLGGGGEEGKRRENLATRSQPGRVRREGIRGEVSLGWLFKKG